ncbi:hypothetical protein MARHY1900 [Marinobacter nauticus ATCC 49840]|nr:hypothetical protein MARHY1900 [Marinobacter nauticus ATCC 49840]
MTALLRLRVNSKFLGKLWIDPSRENFATI